jgi:hypothetical protein
MIFGLKNVLSSILLDSLADLARGFADLAFIFCCLANIGRVRSTLSIVVSDVRFENRPRTTDSAVLTEYLKGQEALQKNGDE